MLLLPTLHQEIQVLHHQLPRESQIHNNPQSLYVVLSWEQH